MQKTFHWFAFLTLFFLMTPEARAQPQGPAATKRPNILLILVDDLGYSDVSPYGGEIFTPNIARLADQGYRLSNFHVGAYCAPTRSMLMTGVDNHVVGLGNMIEIMADNQFGKPGYEGSLNGRAATIATTLRKAGYHTYMAGKWHLGKSKERLPAAQVRGIGDVARRRRRQLGEKVIQPRLCGGALLRRV